VEHERERSQASRYTIDIIYLSEARSVVGTRTCGYLLQSSEVGKIIEF